MDNKIDLLKREVDEITKGLNELKDNVSLSEIEKKNKAEDLKSQAETTKKKIKNEIQSLESKTDNESKKEKEEIEALLNNFNNETTELYTSIINIGSTNTHTKTAQPESENKGIVSKTKDWIGEQWNDIRSKEKWQKEGGKNLLRTAGFLTTGVGTIALAYKGVKKLWNWAFSNDEEEEQGKQEDQKKAESKQKDTESESEEKSNSNKRKEEKKSFQDRRYGKALGRLGIGTAAGGGIYFLGKYFNLWGDDTSNGSEKVESQTQSKVESTPKNDKENLHANPGYTAGENLNKKQQNIVEQKLDKINSPITVKMVKDSCTTHNVPVEYLLGFMQNDSSLGTKGKGAKTHNPGNVGNTDSGGTKDFGTREKGVDACAENLEKRINAYHKAKKEHNGKGFNDFPTPKELATGKSKGGTKFFGVYMTSKTGPTNVTKIINSRVNCLS